jgi:hypothetical protein
MHKHLLAAEDDGTDDPGERLAGAPPCHEPSETHRVAGGARRQLGDLVLCRDAPRPAQRLGGFEPPEGPERPDRLNRIGVRRRRTEPRPICRSAYSRSSSRRATSR